MRNDDRKKTGAAAPKDKAQQNPLNTGPDAIIGYSEETGEPLTKREVFGDGDQLGQASQHIHSGPELSGKARAQQARPVTALEDLQSHGPQPAEAINPEAANQYEAETGSAKGWHSAGAHSRSKQRRHKTPQESEI